MTISNKHKFVSSKSDSADASLVQPSNWNDEHDITLAAGKVLGRDTSGAGVAQELPIAVDSSGNVGIGTSSPTEALDVIGNINSSGTVYAVDFDNVSDAVFKSDIEPLSNASAVLNSLSPVEFRWKNTGEKSFGFIAQEVEVVLPEIVHHKPDATRTVSYIQLIPFLISVVQEQQKQIDDLQKKLN